MPSAPTADFSYDRDIAPQTARFFNKVGADPTLSHEAKMRLQGSTLGGVQGIETQRLKLQEERDQGRARKLDYEASSMRLEEARAARARAEQREARRATVTATAKGILDSADDPETKRQALARTALDFADDKDALDTFDIATKALPKPKESTISDAQTLSMVLDGIPQEEIIAAKESGDYSNLGKIAHKLQKDALAAKEGREAAEDKTKAGMAQKLELAKMPLKFQKPEVDGDEPQWLDDSSTAVATKVVEALGTPEERQRFMKLKTAGSDRERAMMVELIQLRHRFDNERVPDGTSARERASAQTGW